MSKREEAIKVLGTCGIGPAWDTAFVDAIIAAMDEHLAEHPPTHIWRREVIVQSVPEDTTRLDALEREVSILTATVSGGPKQPTDADRTVAEPQVEPGYYLLPTGDQRPAIEEGDKVWIKGEWCPIYVGWWGNKSKDEYIERPITHEPERFNGHTLEEVRLVYNPPNNPTVAALIAGIESRDRRLAELTDSWVDAKGEASRSRHALAEAEDESGRQLIEVQLTSKKLSEAQAEIDKLTASLMRLSGEKFSDRNHTALQDRARRAEAALSTARKDTLREVREAWRSAKQEKHYDLTISIFNATLTRLEQAVPPQDATKEEACSLSGKPSSPVDSGQSSVSPSATSSPGTGHGSGVETTTVIAQGYSDAPLPEPGYRLLARGDGHVVTKGERVYHHDWASREWMQVEGWELSSVQVGYPADPWCWYAAPEPADWPALPPNCRRVQFTDTPQEGDLLRTNTGWMMLGSVPLRCATFDAAILAQGRYARPLDPDPLLTSEERVSEDLEPNRVSNEAMIDTHQNRLNDHAARLDALTGKVEALEARMQQHFQTGHPTGSTEEE